MISVIIITLDEARTLAPTLRALTEQAGTYEVIVVDGGSRDGTDAVAQQHPGVRFLTAARGRASQMNAGAAVARGDVLLFLHADSTLERGALEELGQTMQRREIVGGGFRLQMVGRRRLLNAYLSLSGRWNARATGIFLGDHGLFVRRELFHRLGGFPELDLMEDFFFMKKLRPLGAVVQLRSRCFSSARRFEEKGYWKTMLLMKLLRVSAHLRLPNRWLVGLYNRRS